MKFARGVSGNPAGMRPGSARGRARALEILDTVCNERGSRKILRGALRAEMKKNPIGFFKTVIMPLLPRDARLEAEGGGVVTWESLISSGDGKPGLKLVTGGRREAASAVGGS